MRRRRIELDLDDQGVVLQWNVVLYDRHGRTERITVRPCVLDGPTSIQTALAAALAVTVADQLPLSAEWERWLSDAIEPY